MSQKSVAILGGGVAGLSAAHELVRLGYRVDVYERRPALGGKAQSQKRPATGAGGRMDLPGEHGFRFYPSFYRYLIQTMSEIPLDPRSPGGPTVADNLHACDEAGFGAADGRGLRKMLRREPKTIFELAETLSLFFEDLHMSTLDMGRFGKKVLRYLTSCTARRDEEYEDISWWKFVDGDSYDAKFQKYLRCVPRIMVAMDPRRGSARTIGNISMQLIVDYARDGVSNDRTLVGPTTEKWIRPWQAFLEQQGVVFHLGQGCRALTFDRAENRITNVYVEGSRAPVTADHYVLAVPLEAAVELVTDEMGDCDEISKLCVVKQQGLADSSGLVGLDEMKMTDWMVGIQFYLREDVPLVRGHVFLPDSPWALSAISQDQFWALSSEGRFRERYGDGTAGGVLSVDISDWNEPGIVFHKPAKRCTRDEIRIEVWEQLKAGLNGVERALLTDDLLAGEPNLDQEIEFPESSPDAPRNGTPLLVHPPLSWKYRPTAGTGIDNLFLAADYVRNETILACMEGANEAARNAVKAILEKDGKAYDRADMPLKEPEIFEKAKAIDKVVYDAMHDMPAMPFIPALEPEPGGPARPGASADNTMEQWNRIWADDPQRPMDLERLSELEGQIRDLAK